MALVVATGLARRYEQQRPGLFASRRHTTAVSGLDLTIDRGEIVGLIGESGSGKSTVGRMILGLERPDAGEVLIEGKPMPAIGTSAWRQLRQSAQMIFQDPHSALDPRSRILDQVREPLDIFDIGDPAQRYEQAARTLGLTGLGPEVHARFPAALSGGQKQRVVIARALVLRPRLLVCDEPVSALDVSVGAQVIDLLADLHQAEGLSYLVISHDLSLVRSLVQRVAVMHAGRLVEEAPVKQIFAAPRHPYTRLLISSVPIADPARRRPRAPVAEPEDRRPDTKGCRFLARCPRALARCRSLEPDLSPAPHRTACHNPFEGAQA